MPGPSQLYTAMFNAKVEQARAGFQSDPNAAALDSYFKGRGPNPISHTYQFGGDSVDVTLWARSHLLSIASEGGQRIVTASREVLAYTTPIPVASEGAQGATSFEDHVRIEAIRRDMETRANPESLSSLLPYRSLSAMLLQRNGLKTTAFTAQPLVFTELTQRYESAEALVEALLPYHLVLGDEHIAAEDLRDGDILTKTSLGETVRSDGGYGHLNAQPPALEEVPSLLELVKLNTPYFDPQRPGRQSGQRQTHEGDDATGPITHHVPNLWGAQGITEDLSDAARYVFTTGGTPYLSRIPLPRDTKSAEGASQEDVVDHEE